MSIPHEDLQEFEGKLYAAWKGEVGKTTSSFTRSTTAAIGSNRASLAETPRLDLVWVHTTDGCTWLGKDSIPISGSSTSTCTAACGATSPRCPAFRAQAVPRWRTTTVDCTRLGKGPTRTKRSGMPPRRTARAGRARTDYSGGSDKRRTVVVQLSRPPVCSVEGYEQRSGALVCVLRRFDVESTGRDPGCRQQCRACDRGIPGKSSTPSGRA